MINEISIRVSSNGRTLDSGSKGWGSTPCTRATFSKSYAIQVLPFLGFAYLLPNIFYPIPNF